MVSLLQALQCQTENFNNVATEKLVEKSNAFCLARVDMVIWDSYTICVYVLTLYYLEGHL